jgi:hypothetical protein
MTKPKPIAIDLIRIDAGTQFRAAINQDRVTDYAELFDGSKDWPFDSACEVYFDGVEYFLVDGFHRYHAGKRVKRASLSCVVHSGTQRDAIKFALSANARHGLHRSNEDKRKAVSFAINDVEWRRLSNRLIAEMCGVSEFLVRDMVNEERKIKEQRAKDQYELTAIESQSNEKKIGKDGRLTAKPKADPKPEPKQDEGDHTPTYAQTEDHWEDVDDPTESELEAPEAKPEQAETPQALRAPIQAVATHFNGHLKELKRLRDCIGGEWLDITDLETQIKLLNDSIRKSVYWIDCMDCGGKGCKTCRQLGWLSLDRKKFLTQEQKDKVGV